MTAEWVSAIASAIGAMGILFVALQTWLASRSLRVSHATLEKAATQLELTQKALNQTAEQICLSQKTYIDSHELERRKNAIELMIDWSSFIERSGTASKNFSERLDWRDTEKLFKEQALAIDKKYKDYLERDVQDLPPIDPPSDGKDQVTLNQEHTAVIRRQVASYLNHLESILAARRHGVADRKMLKEQFENLVVPERGKSILRNFRILAGGKMAFPAIDEFVGEINSVKETPSPGLIPTGVVD